MKYKIITVVLCAVIAGAGFFACLPTAYAQTPAAVSALNLDQLEQMIIDIQKQIAQIISILQQRNNAVCGNGKCDPGESNSNCPKDCLPTCAQKCNKLGYAKGTCVSGLDQEKNFIGFQQNGQVNVNTAFNGAIDCQPGIRCVCTVLSPTFCAKEGEQFTEDEYKLCCSGLETVAKIDGTYVCRKTNRTCADNLEMVYNDLMGAMKCCDPGAGIAPPENTGDAGEIKGFCVKDWNKTCGNGVCDPLEHYFNCPWDCPPDAIWSAFGSTCSVGCLGSNASGGRCVNETTTLPPQCAAGEFPFTANGSTIPGFSDCNLFGQPKNILKICCCRN